MSEPANLTLGENVSIGDGVEIGANVVIHDGTVIGDNCVLQDNVVLGKQPRLGSRSTFLRRPSTAVSITRETTSASRHTCSSRSRREATLPSRAARYCRSRSSSAVKGIGSSSRIAAWASKSTVMPPKRRMLDRACPRSRSHVRNRLRTRARNSSRPNGFTT